MRLSEIVARAESFGLRKSREVHEVKLTFESTDQSNRFVQWCADHNIATSDTLGIPVVTVYVAG